LRCVARCGSAAFWAREAVFSSTGFRIRAAQPAAVTAPVARWAERLAASLFFTLFPADCRICSAPLIEISRIPVCKNCVSEPRPLSGSFCGVCGEVCDFPSGLDPARARCRLCQKLHPPFDRAVAYGSYDGALRDLIHLLKFDQVRPLAPVLGRLLADAIAALEPSLPTGRIAVVPVPLYPKKKTQRGFNQAEVIARAALQHLARPERFDFAGRALARTRDTGSQIGLSRRQRRQNLRGAFAVSDPTPILDRHILLVDDVYTTGATASECARVLLRAGAKRVWVATVARTLKISEVSAIAEGLSWQRSQEENREESERVATAASVR
jgi:ComF family protein